MALMKQDVCASVRTNADAPQKAFTLKTDAEATKRHLNILVNMYTRPELAVVRETLQNAFDASPDGTVLVTLPDEYTYEYSVKDQGRGMTAADLDTKVGVAGESDKSGNAKQAGEFGIGSLCPLTYTDAFTITSWKDGFKSTLTAYKQDDGSLGYNVSDPVASKNPNGTLVTVPIHRNSSDIAKFQEALDSFRFSPALAKRIKLARGTFEAYPVQNQRDVKVGSHVVSFWSVNERSSLFGQVVILVNDIPVAANLDRFPALKEFSESVFSTDNTSEKTTLVISFPAEAGISVPPNRETVMVTKINTALISNACAKYLEQLTHELEHGTPTPDCAPAARALWQKLSLQLGKKPADCKKDADKQLGAILEPHGLFAKLSSYTLYNRSSSQLGVEMHYLFANERPAVLRFESRWNRGSYAWTPKVTATSHPAAYSDGSRWHPKGQAAEATNVGVVPCTTKYARIIVWPEAKNAWTNAYLRKLVTAWLYDIAENAAPMAQHGPAPELLLVGEAPAPDSLIAKSGIPIVDFEQWQKDHTLEDDNPFLAKTTERAARGAKSRRQFNSKEWSDQGELPKAGFAYATCMRGTLEMGQFQKAYQEHWGYQDGCEQLRTWLGWFETSGISDPLTVTCLTEGDAENLKRKHLKLESVLTERMKLFIASLDEDEKDWFPRAWFAAALEAKAPKLLEFLRSMDASGYVKGDADFEPILAATRPPPSTRMARVLAACKKHIADETDLSWRFRGFTECQDVVPIESGSYHQAAFYSIPCEKLAQAAFALRRLSKRSDPMAVWTRIVWYAFALKGEATLIGQVNWLLPLPTSDLYGKENTAMAIPDALAKA